MARQQQQQSDGGGCVALVLVLAAIAAVGMGIISFAALVDPFSWLPPVGEIWEDCEGECDLAVRFPGFWPRVAANLAYVTACVGFLGWLMVAVSDLRKARAQRFAGWEQARRYGASRRAITAAAAASAALAALPMVVALA